MATKLSVEEIYFTAAHLAECATNVFQVDNPLIYSEKYFSNLEGVNGVLQGRMNRLQLDSIRTGENLYDQKQLVRTSIRRENAMHVSSILVE